MEAQTSPDGIIVLRVFEYGFQYALLSKTQDNILHFPEPVVIYLNEEDDIPEESILHISFGCQGTFNYRVRNYCYLAHDMEELDCKKMIVLIPFQVMRLRSLLEKMKQSKSKNIPFNMDEFNQLRDEIKADIMKSIKTNQHLGNVTYDDARQLTELTNQLYQRICADFRKIGGPKDMRPLLPGAFELPNDKYRLRIAALEEENARYADENARYADEITRFTDEITLLKKRITELEAGSK